MGVIYRYEENVMNHPKKWAALFLLTAGTLYATSHCYKQRTNCFVVDDGKEIIQIFEKRNTFIETARKHGLSKARIERMIKKGEEREAKPRSDREKSDRYDDWHGFGYAYPSGYWYHHHDHDHHPDRPTTQPIHPPAAQPVTPPANVKPVGRPMPQPRPTPRPVRRAR